MSIFIRIKKNLSLETKHFLSYIISEIYIRLKLLLSIIWAIPCLLSIRLIYPIYRIRFGLIDSTRIGHFTPHSILYWADYQKLKKRHIDIFWCSKKVSNVYWYELVKRHLPIKNFVFYLNYWNNILPGGKKHKLESPIWLAQANIKKDIIPFATADIENKKGNEWLSKFGITESDKFVCLIVRDSHYLDNDTNLNKNNWNYHSYRDTDINTYLKAMDWLTLQGYYVFRMGKLMKKRINSSNPRIIDYAFLEDRSDFLDIWLFANCDLCISTGTGPDIVSDIYNKPILFLNYLPLTNIWSWSNALTVPKRLFWKESGRELNLKEYFIANYGRTEDYDKEGIKIIDLEPDEILAATIEISHRINNTWIDSDSNKQSQEKFWRILKSIPTKLKMHGWINPKNFIGSDWLNSINIPED